jgi:hypothetical protein
LDLLSFFVCAVQCLFPTNSPIFINTSRSKDAGDAFWNERKEMAGKKFKGNVCGRMEENGSFSFTNHIKKRKYNTRRRC